MPPPPPQEWLVIVYLCTCIPRQTPTSLRTCPVLLQESHLGGSNREQMSTCMCDRDVFTHDTQTQPLVSWCRSDISYNHCSTFCVSWAMLLRILPSCSAAIPKTENQCVLFWQAHPFILEAVHIRTCICDHLLWSWDITNGFNFK